MTNTVGYHIDRMLKRYRARRDAGEIVSNTLKAAQRNYARLGLYWNDKAVSDITSGGWDQFQDWYSLTYYEQDFSNQLKFFRVLVKSLFNDGILEKKPELKNRFAKAERIRRRHNKSKIFSADELHAIFTDPMASRVLIDCCYMYHDCAMRFSEVPALTWERVSLDPDDPWVYFSEVDHKANYESWVPLSERCLVMLRARKEHSKSVYIFCDEGSTIPVTRNRLKINQLFDRLGIDKASFHTFRRTRLTALFGNSKIENTDVMTNFRVSLQVALEHYIKPTKESRARVRGI